MFREKDGLVMWAMKPFEDRIKPAKKSVCHLDMNLSPDCNRKVTYKGNGVEGDRKVSLKCQNKCSRHNVEKNDVWF